MLRSQIVGVGSYTPENVIKNDDLKQWMDTSDEWITQRTGIKERRWRDPNQATSDLALIAAQRALSSARLESKDLDMIIFATISPDHEFPGSGCFLQSKLGVSGIPALDIRQQCSGFIFGLSIADQFIRSGMKKKILMVGAEVHSYGLDVSTRGRDVAVLFGDGAGAVVVSAVDVQDEASDKYIYSTHLHTDGSHAKELWTPAPGTGLGSQNRFDPHIFEHSLQYPQMNGKKVYLSAVRFMSEVLMEGLTANRLSINDIDLFLFHQANLRINEAVSDHLKIPREKVFNTIDRFGNTTAATIPLGMDEAIKAGKLKPGMRVAMAAFGSGYTWASAVLRY